MSVQDAAAPPEPASPAAQRLQPALQRIASERGWPILNLFA